MALLFTRSLRFLDHCFQFGRNLRSLLGGGFLSWSLLRLGLLVFSALGGSGIEVAHLAHDGRFNSG